MSKPPKPRHPICALLVAVFYSLRQTQQQGQLAKAKQLLQQLLDLQERAAQYGVPNDFGARLQLAGAAGLNASKSHDATLYVTSLPSNVLELWFALEAERFQVGSGSKDLVLPVRLSGHQRRSHGRSYVFPDPIWKGKLSHRDAVCSLDCHLPRSLGALEL